MRPTTADIEKRQAKLEGFLKKIDPETGITPDSVLLTMVRGAIRKSWMQSPTKLAFLLSKSVPDMDDNRRKWKVQCSCCGEWFKESDVEVDHKHGNQTFKTVEDFQKYFEKILKVGFDDLQILCKSCHSIKTHSEKRGITFDEARIEKQAIAIVDSKKEKEWLSERGITPASNAPTRRAQIIEELTKQQ